MTLRGWRIAVAILFVVLGTIIVARGLIEEAPAPFVLMGALMIVLGVYRLRMYYAASPGRR